MNNFAPLKFTTERRGMQIDVELPFVVGIMAYLNRTSSESKTPLEERQFVSVDRDNLDEFFEQIQPSITLNLAHTKYQIQLSFNSFEDTQPIRLKKIVTKELAKHEALTFSESEMREASDEILQNEDLRELLGSLHGIHQLLSNTPNDSNLIIRVLDVSKEELINDANFGLTQESALYRLIYLYEYGTFEGTPYSLILTDFDFCQYDTDMKVLEYLAVLGAKADCIFFTKAASRILGDTILHTDLDWETFDTNFSSREFLRWRAFRDHQSSRFIAMMLALRSDITASNIQVITPVFGAALDFIRSYTENRLWNFTNKNNVSFNETGLIKTQLITALSRSGFNVVNFDTGALITPLNSLISLQRPRKYFEKSANDTAIVMASVSYNLIVTDFVRYIAMIIREKLGSCMDIESLTHMVNQWLNFYIDDTDRQNKDSLGFLKPLNKAFVSIEEVAGVPGLYQGVLNIQLKIEGVDRPPCTKHEFNVLCF